MIHKKFLGLEWLEFELLADFPIIHGCFTRQGGVSSGLLESLNVGRNVGDLPENVAANFKKIGEVLCLSEIASAKLCHGDDVTQISTHNRQHLPLSDGLTTSLPGFAIAVSQADCQAAIFYDPVRHAMANVHCGWRGSGQNIYGKTIQSMQKDYGSHPKDILVCISPSLGPQHAEFIHYRNELPEAFWTFEVKDNHFDFWEISRWQLEGAGVLADHIQVAEVDTYTALKYFSHRRSTHQKAKQCGRQATVCALC